MSDLNLQKTQKGRMTIVPRLEATTLHVALEGICDSFAVKGLGTYLSMVADEVRRLGIECVDVDISQVSLLNSSCIKQFITFLRPIKAGELACTVNFTVAAEVPWQRRSMSALARMCPSAVSLGSRGDGGGNPSRNLSYARPLSTAP